MPLLAASVNRGAAGPNTRLVRYPILPGTQSLHAIRIQGDTHSWRLPVSRKPQTVRALEDGLRLCWGTEKHPPCAFLRQVGQVRDGPESKRCGSYIFGTKRGNILQF